MHESVIQSLAKLTGKSQDEIKTGLESSPETVAQTIAAIKPFNQSEVDAMFDNRLKTLTIEDVKRLPDTLTSELYNTHKANVLEKSEKRIQEALGTNYIQGKDYKSIVELTQLIAKDGKGSESNTDYKAMLQEAQAKHEKELETVKSEGFNKVKNLVLSGALDAVKGMVKNPTENEQKLNYLKYEFENKYDLREMDGKIVPVNKETNKPDYNEAFEPIGVNTIFTTMAKGILPIENTVPIGGRGGEQNPPAQPAGDAKYTAYKTVDEFIDKGLTEMGIDKDSPEAYQELAKFAEATGQ